MMNLNEREPLVQGLCFIIQNQDTWSESILSSLIENFGPTSYKGTLFPFTSGSYYYSEMGQPLYRGVISFSQLWQTQYMVEAKLKATEIEKKLSTENKRKFNIDVGYFDQDKLVLASFKRSGPKLYLKQGVYADMLLLYQKGSFVPFEWAFADFKADTYYKDLLAVRERYKKALRQNSN